MKKSSQDILNWFSNIDYENQLQNFMTANSSITEFETTIGELRESFSFSKQKVLMAIQSGKIDSLSLNKRHQIMAYLTTISTHLQQLQRFNFAASQPIARQLSSGIFNSIIQLSDLIESSTISQNILKDLDYKNLMRELLNTKNKYETLVKQIDSVEKLLKNSMEGNNKLNEITKTSTKTIQEVQQSLATANNLRLEIDKIYKNITNSAQDIESKRVTINSTYNISKELTQKIENSQVDLKTAIQNLDSTYESSINKQKNSFEAKLRGFEKSTSDILDKNKELQLKVNDLLEGANAGRLYKSFHWRKLQLEKNQRIWIASIIAINLIIVAFTFLIINGSEFLGIEGINGATINSAFLMKLFLTLPLLFLDWFFLRQYNINKDLIENYAYKSVISTSLLAYNQMIKEHGDNKQSLDFLVNTVEKIYMTPFNHNDSNKDEFDIIRKIAEKGIDGLTDIAKSTSNVLKK